MDKDYLVLKRASASRPSGEWNDDDFDVLADGAMVGRIMKAAAASVGTPWLWTFGRSWPTDQRMACRLVRCSPIHREAKKAPGVPGL